MIETNDLRGVFMSKISTTAESRAPSKQANCLGDVQRQDALVGVRGVADSCGDHPRHVQGVSPRACVRRNSRPRVASDESPATPATASQTPATPATPAKADATAARPAAAQATAGISDDDKKLAERSNSPMVKSLTDTAKPSELPKVNPLELNDKP